MLRPDILWKNPVMFVVEVGTVLSIIYTLYKIIDPARRVATLGYLIAARRLAVPDGAVRELRRGAGRGPRQGPGRRAPQDPARRRRPYPPALAGRGRIEETVSTELKAGDLVVVEAGPDDPRRRRDRRGHRRRSTSRRSPANRPRSSARPAATAPASPAAPGCCPTASSSGSPPAPASRSSTA